MKRWKNRSPGYCETRASMPTRVAGLISCPPFSIAWISRTLFKPRYSVMSRSDHGLYLSTALKTHLTSDEAQHGLEHQIVGDAATTEMLSIAQPLWCRRVPGPASTQTVHVARS